MGCMYFAAPMKLAMNSMQKLQRKNAIACMAVCFARSFQGCIVAEDTCFSMQCSQSCLSG